jgi:N6-L-threonylcarbamoyladenine synthase
MSKNTKQFPYLLSVETSCDDTSVALVNAQGFVLDQIQLNQDNRHQIFGGVVPEIASRAHAETLLPLIDKILKKNEMEIPDLEGFAVTNRPGLLGSILVGVMTVKTLAQAFHKPMVGVNHLIGHIAAPLLWDQKHPFCDPAEVPYPWLVLAVSGGHTSLYLVEKHNYYHLLGQTRDDAAGEAFDKFAKMLGLGFPGGALVEQLAFQVTEKDQESPPFIYPSVRPQLPGFDFSFSGLKSAADRLYRSRLWKESEKAYFAYRFQEDIVQALMLKLDQAYQKFLPKTVMVTGGVSANSHLRASVEQWAQMQGMVVKMPPLRYCTDNAAMIGLAGWWSWDKRVYIDSQCDQFNPSPHWDSHDFIKTTSS